MPPPRTTYAHHNTPHHTTPHHTTPHHTTPHHTTPHHTCKRFYLDRRTVGNGPSWAGSNTKISSNSCWSTSGVDKGEGKRCWLSYITNKLIKAHYRGRPTSPSSEVGGRLVVNNEVICGGYCQHKISTCGNLYKDDKQEVKKGGDYIQLR
jgi:hypothetical protein